MRGPSSETEAEHRRIRSSNDRDQKDERDGRKNRHNAGYDEAADGKNPEPAIVLMTPVAALTIRIRPFP